MSNTFIKSCSFCNIQIRMAEMASGQWLPFELDGSGRHSCSRNRDSAYSKPKAKGSARVRTMQPSESATWRVRNSQQQQSLGSLLFWIVVFLLILLRGLT